MDIDKQIKKKVRSWRWRIVKAGLTMEKFCEITGRSQSQLSEWVTERKTPRPENVDAVERELKNMGV